MVISLPTFAASIEQEATQPQLQCAIPSFVPIATNGVQVTNDNIHPFAGYGPGTLRMNIKGGSFFKISTKDSIVEYYSMGIKFPGILIVHGRTRRIFKCRTFYNGFLVAFSLFINIHVDDFSIRDTRRAVRVRTVSSHITHLNKSIVQFTSKDH
jgi:hypothetical protein